MILNRQIVLGNIDHEQLFGFKTPVDAQSRALELIAGNPVAVASIDDVTSDLSLEFLGGLELQIFNMSWGYEGWQLVRPESGICSLGGGGVAEWDW